MSANSFGSCLCLNKMAKRTARIKAYAAKAIQIFGQSLNNTADDKVPSAFIAELNVFFRISRKVGLLGVVSR